MMANSIKKQKGLTFISLMVILAVLGFFIFLGLKIGPIYLNNSKVENALTALKEMPNIQSMSKYEMRLSLAKRFDLNYVTKVNLDDVTILKQGDYVKVEIEYERVEKMIGNLSVLVHFDEAFELGEQE